MRQVLLLIALLSLSAQPSNGATITASADFETVPADLRTCSPQPCFGGAPNPVELRGTIDPFDASLGTLQSVQFGIFTGSGSGNSYVYIETPGDHAFTLEYRRSLTAPDGTLLAEAGWQTQDNPFGVHATEPGFYFVTGGNSFSMWRPLVTDHLTVFSESADPFIYTVSFRFRRSGLDLPDDERYFLTDFFTGSASTPTSVVYEYLPVPVPGTACLVASGLGILARRSGRLRKAAL